MKTLKIEELSKNFGSTEVLKKINLEIDEGNFLVLLGPSGCGKSTLLNIIAGLETINEGDVFIDDYNVSKVEPKDRNIAMVFQSYALYPSMNVRENMIFGLKQAKSSKEKIQEQLEKVSKFLQVDQLLERKPSQLSGGQRQRVAIGRALVREPRIFLFDEPLSNLDAKLRVEMRREIKKLHQQLKTTVVYVTHDQTEAMSLGTNIAIMNHGVIQQNDTPEKIYNKPSNTFVADFIGEMTQFRGIITGKSSIKIGNTELNTAAHQFDEGREVSLTIRPEDIIPLGAKPPTKNGLSNSRNNVFSTKLVEMEFLGSFWRCKLKSDEFSQALVTADFSVNAVRRLSLEPNQNLWIELPSESILAFDNQAA